VPLLLRPAFVGGALPERLPGLEVEAEHQNYFLCSELFAWACVDAS
jgi:hypothetical protein